MKPPVVLLGVLLAATVLAGCADSAQPKASIPNLRVTDSTGILLGVVVDGSITPIAGATVRVEGPDAFTEDLTTAEDGTFAMDGLAPGGYSMLVKKLGFLPVRSGTVVEAGVADPPAVKILLEADPSGLPYATPYTLEGFIECSVRAGGPGVGTLGLNACDTTSNAGVGEQKSSLVVPLDKVPDLLQAELVWESTQSLGSSLTLVVGPPNCDDIKYARADGPNPQVIILNGTQLEQFDVTTDGVCYRVFTWVADESQGTLGATVSQKFTLFVHAFYGYAPPEGWTFYATNQIPPPQ